MAERRPRGARFAVRVALVMVGLSLMAVALPRRASAQVDVASDLAARLGSRVPVVLVPGWSDDSEQLRPLRDRFLEAGWPDSAVVSLSFEDPEGSNRVHARALAMAVERLRERVGAPEVDVVAHSMGGLALRYYLQNGGAENVRRVVFLATPHRGTYAAWLAWGKGGEEMDPGSLFLLSLQKGRAVPPGVEGITVRTPVDLHILPPESATLPPLPDIEVCCPTHAGLLDDEETFKVILSFLER